MKVGRFVHNVDVSSEYKRLAKEDERVSLFLNQSGDYRHSAYFAIQAMEKYVRAKIFSIVDARNQYFREKNRNHSVEDALDFLVEVINGNSYVREQIKNQINEYVLKDIRFNILHNNLRYPTHFEKFNSYSCLEISKQDTEIILQRLKALKAFIADIDRFK